MANIEHKKVSFCYTLFKELKIRKEKKRKEKKRGKKLLAQLFIYAAAVELATIVGLAEVPLTETSMPFNEAAFAL